MGRKLQIVNSEQLLPTLEVAISSWNNKCKIFGTRVVLERAGYIQNADGVWKPTVNGIKVGLK